MTYKKEIVIFWFCPEIFEYCLLPVSLHVIPVVYHTMPDRVVYTVAGCFCIGKCFIADKEIEVFYAAFGREVARFGRDRRSS